MGTLPRAALLLTRYGIVKGEFDNYFSLAMSFGLSIKDGVITFKGEERNPNYSDEWSEVEAMKDWAKNYVKGNLDNSYKIYKFLL